MLNDPSVPLNRSISRNQYAILIIFKTSSKLILPSCVIPILEPDVRGEEPQVWMTVASAMDFPSFRQWIRSGRISRISAY